MKKINKDCIYILVSTFFLLFLIHFPLFTKNIISADILLNNFFYKGYQWEISLGRFGLWVIGIIKGYLSIPIIDLGISFILISIVTYLLIQLFEIKNKLSIVLVILMMGVSPIISSTLLFHYCAIGYFLSFLCSVLSIYISYKSKNRYIKTFIPIVLIVISLSMYQAYLSVITTLFILYNIWLILHKKYHYKEFLKYLLLLIVGIVIYFILMKISLKILHISISNYSNADKIGIHTILRIPSKIVDSYRLFIDFYLSDNIMKNHYFHHYIFNGLLFVLMIIFIAQSIIKNKIKTRMILLISILLFFLPIFLNSVIFVISDSKLQLLMGMSYILIPIFIFSFESTKICQYILLFVTAILLRNYYIQDQATYLSLEKTFQSYHTVIMNAVQNNYDKKFMMIGDISHKEEAIYQMNYGFVSDDPIFWGEYHLRKLAFCKYVDYYLGVPVEFVEQDMYDLFLQEQYDKVINYKDEYIIINFNNV